MATTREARIIFPKADNDGQPIDTAPYLRWICKAFGGATVAEARGIWADDNGVVYDEPGYVVDVAMEDTAANEATMRSIAWAFARNYRQLAMYLRGANGVVHIINTAGAVAEAA